MVVQEGNGFLKGHGPGDVDPDHKDLVVAVEVPVTYELLFQGMLTHLPVNKALDYGVTFNWLPGLNLVALTPGFQAKSCLTVTRCALAISDKVSPRRIV